MALKEGWSLTKELFHWGFHCAASIFLLLILLLVCVCACTHLRIVFIDMILHFINTLIIIVTIISLYFINSKKEQIKVPPPAPNPPLKNNNKIDSNLVHCHTIQQTSKVHEGTSPTDLFKDKV